MRGSGSLSNEREDTVSAEAHEATSATIADTGPGPAVDVEEIQRQRDEYYDLLLRKTAEFENYRKRTDRERQSVSEAATADLLGELLPLVDDLERALKPTPASTAPNAYRRGVELIHRQLVEVLRKRGVRPIEALGADFDPHFHQAVAHDAAEGRRDGEVSKNSGGGTCWATGCCGPPW